jgi:hypothetical protein
VGAETTKGVTLDGFNPESVIAEDSCVCGQLTGLCLFLLRGQFGGGDGVGCHDNAVYLFFLVLSKLNQ